ncbi:chondroitin sulfate synthase 3-like [Protopterus annectens]|uniref:chondroitin sulfate synthase 3-like n=1 Tax=Protopterus annectens TaxID=7888 RepID=UPI001CFA6D98|nr:chondroitin sulfate synthase 3-like [Protopterus annectens]
MAVKSRQPCMSVVIGLVLGFTAASWLVVPRVVEINGKKRNSNLCSYYSNVAGVGKLGDLGDSMSSSTARQTNGPPASQEETEDDDGSRYRTSNGSGDGTAPTPRTRNFLYVGVMTAKKYLDSRAVAVYRTWASSIPGKVEFFSSEGSEDVSLPIAIPVISLAGVDDSYPPQKKSFMMLKYMHDYYLDKFEWFMRADDDVYIKGEKLEEFLRSLNSSKPLYLGQTGLGTTEELGKLALEPGENFCMGGPGMIFSREVLRRMVPHIGECLREMYTTHEDVEVGRCVRRFGGTQCVWSYEVRKKKPLL